MSNLDDIRKQQSKFAAFTTPRSRAYADEIVKLKAELAATQRKLAEAEALVQLHKHRLTSAVMQIQLQTNAMHSRGIIGFTLPDDDPMWYDEYRTELLLKATPPTEALAALLAAERERIAKWYEEDGWKLDEDDLPNAIRSLK